MTTATAEAPISLTQKCLNDSPQRCGKVFSPGPKEGHSRKDLVFQDEECGRHTLSILGGKHYYTMILSRHSLQEGSMKEDTEHQQMSPRMNRCFLRALELSFRARFCNPYAYWLLPYSSNSPSEIREITQGTTQCNDGGIWPLCSLVMVTSHQSILLGEGHYLSYTLIFLDSEQELSLPLLVAPWYS